MKPAELVSHPLINDLQLWLGNGVIACCLLGLVVALLDKLAGRKLPVAVMLSAWFLVLIRSWLPALIPVPAKASLMLPGSVLPSTTPAWLPGIILFWLLTGVSLLLICLHRYHHWRKHLLTHTATRSPDEIQHLLDEVLQNFPVGRCQGIQLITSTRTESPFVIGFRHPVLVLPDSAITDHSEDELRLILAHEVAHIYRHDPYWRLAALITSCIFWFNPVIWVAQRRFGQYLEQACDQTVMQRYSGQRTQYQHLLARQIAAVSQPRLGTTGLYGNNDLQRCLRLNQVHTDKGFTVAAVVMLASALSFSLSAPEDRTPAAWMAAQDIQTLPGSINKRLAVYAKLSEQQQQR